MNGRTRTWQDNAREFAELDRGEGWPFAALVACSVEKDDGIGNCSDRNSCGKVSARRFAEHADTSPNRILRFLRTWEKAAAEGHCLPSADLNPGDALTVQLPSIPFPVHQPQGAGLHIGDDRKDAMRRQAAIDGIGPSKAIDIASNPKALIAAIKADANTAAAANGPYGGAEMAGDGIDSESILAAGCQFAEWG